jgi:hypothetical protein
LINELHQHLVPFFCCFHHALMSKRIGSFNPVLLVEWPFHAFVIHIMVEHNPNNSILKTNYFLCISWWIGIYLCRIYL